MKKIITIEVDEKDVHSIINTITSLGINARLEVDTRYDEKDKDIQDILSLVPLTHHDEVALNLDEVVHDLNGVEAAEVDNGGLESQVCFLAQKMGLEGARQAVLNAFRQATQA